MLRATTIVRKAAVRADKVADTVTLAQAGRRLQGETPMSGATLEFVAAPAKRTDLEDGDALRLEDGRLVLVRAAQEPLLEIRAENPARLMRLAWQLGSNHVAVEVAGESLYVLDVPVTAELVRGSGCAATPVHRAFKAEREVEAHDHAHCGHDHHHDRDHHHDHGHHDHGHAHHGDHDHGHDHDHASHGHDHAHDHAGSPSHRSHD